MRINYCLLVVTLLQVTLLSLSQYYASIANERLNRAAETPSSQSLPLLDEFMHYRNLDDYFGYVAATIWVMVLVVIKWKKVPSSNRVDLAVYFPLLLHTVFMFF